MTGDVTCDYGHIKEPKTLSQDAFSRAQKPQMRLAADGELDRSPRPSSRNRGKDPTFKGKGEGRGENGG